MAALSRASFSAQTALLGWGRISVQETEAQSVNQWLIMLASCQSPYSDARAVIITSHDTKFEILFSMQLDGDYVVGLGLQHDLVMRHIGFRHDIKPPRSFRV